MDRQTDQQREFLAKAEAGDGAFAIAYALLKLAAEQSSTAAALRALATADAGTRMEALHLIGAKLEQASEGIATALEGRRRKVPI